MSTEIVITGLGAVTPLGFNITETWNNLLEGKSAIKRQNGYLVSELDCGNVSDKTYLMFFNAVNEAINDANLPTDSNVAFVLSQSKPNIKILENFPENIIGNIGLRIAENFNFKNKCVKNVVAACATGIQSIYSAILMLRSNQCDVAVVGVAESSLCEIYLNAFKNMGVLSQQIVRPFDRKRDGFAIGEGAGVCVLEKEISALNRGAKIYAKIKNCLISSALDIVNFENKTDILADTIKKSMLPNENIDYINAHGTATKINDAMEVKALKSAFGNNIYDMYVSSTKAATGHLLGASGIVEFIFTTLSVYYGAIPPTLNLEEPLADLNFVPKVSIKKKVKNAMSLSYGFGGQIGVIICGL